MAVPHLLRKHWFLFGILGCIMLAEIIPSLGATGGPLKPEWTVKYGAVALIFFISGLSLSISEVVSATTRFRVHIFILSFSFIFIPFIIIIMNTALRKLFGVNEWLLKGLATVSCMPPPVSSAVILTKSVGGNEAVAVFNSVVGSLLGIILTPMALLFFLGTTAVVSIVNSLFTLGHTVLLPLFIGQAVQHFGVMRGIHKFPMSSVSQCALLFIIFTTFCDVFKMHDAAMNASDVLITVMLVLLLQMFLLYISFQSAVQIYNPTDVVAITFCSTHKSLTLGVSILRILFSGYAHYSQILLPLLVYHPTQIILGGMLVPTMKKWLSRTKARTKLLP